MPKYTNKIVAFITLCFIVMHHSAQILNSSPYTRYGIGEPLEIGTSAYTGIAGASVAFSNPGQINYSNPASYGTVRKNSPVLDAGYRANIITNKTALSSQQNVVSGLRNFGLLMPFSSKTGVVIGVMPYATSGYQLDNKQLFDGDTMTFNYIGNGSINRAIIGLGQQLINKGDSVKLSFGVNVSLLFGTLQRDRNVIFQNNSYYNTRITDKTIIRGATYDIGTQYSQKIAKNTLLNIGATYTIGNQINSFNDFYAYNFKYGNFNTELEKDTVAFYEDVKGKINLPSSLALAVAIAFNKKVTIAAQYSFQNWQDFYEIKNGIEVFEPNMIQSRKTAVGIEYSPNSDFDTPDKKAFQLATYRLGAHYGYTPYNLANTHLPNYGINFGITLPLISSFTWSSLNIGCEIGKMGTINNELIQQNYIKLNLGLSLSPNKKHDKWFYKRLYE